MRKVVWLIVLFAATVEVALVPVHSQAPKVPTTPEEIVQEWLARWTRLDGTDATAEQFADLYLPDGIHDTGPSPRQIGLVHYEGHSDIRQMAKAFGSANSEITFRIQTVSAREKSADIIHMGTGPWGGPAVGIEYIAAYTVKKDKKRYMSTGAAFLQIEQGKIRRVRMYTPREEIMEIQP